MHHVPLTIAKDTARELWRAYQKHKHYSTPIDKEIMSAYQKLAQGKLVIKAMESVATAGLDAQGLPKLALCRADARSCRVTMRNGGDATMTAILTSDRRTRRVTFGSGAKSVMNWPEKTFASR